MIIARLTPASAATPSVATGQRHSEQPAYRTAPWPTDDRARPPRMVYPASAIRPARFEGPVLLAAHPATRDLSGKVRQWRQGQGNLPRGCPVTDQPTDLLTRIALGPTDPRKPDWFARVLVAVLGLLIAAGAVMAVAS